MPAWKVTCGVDEAGRGPLAGPVYAAAVILDPARPIDGLADSKLLAPVRRSQLADLIRERASDWAIATATVAEIDTLNILNATLLSMKRAVEMLRIRPDEVLIDGRNCPALGVPARPVIRGDATVAEISAASILAKTARDLSMIELHQRLPQYGFHRHKGYPTPEHLDALKEHGVSPEHRRSFSPVRRLVEAGSE